MRVFGQFRVWWKILLLFRYLYRYIVCTVPRSLSTCVAALLFPLAVVSYGQEIEPTQSDTDRYLGYIMRMPNHVQGNPRAVVRHLNKYAETKKERVSLIYYWIASNISYDVAGYGSKVKHTRTPQQVFTEKRGTYRGYVDLFKLMCDEANVKCVVITGYAKGYNFTGERLAKANHAWNAVWIDNTWELVDVTWGSGYVQNNGDAFIFRRALDTDYLFSKPEGFIIQHFPEDIKWQLLETPISVDDFYSDDMNFKAKRVGKYLK
jgi:transglutaminase/protease-like cytokinesis protein 3